MKFFRLLKSVLFGTLIVVCICGCGKDTAHYVTQEDSQSETLEGEVSVKENETADKEPLLEEGSTTAEQEKLLYIYLCGAVEQEGVYTLPEGSRVCDAFAAAGGLSPEAAKDYWNQARLLTDGEMLYVPTQEEAKERNFPQQGAFIESSNTPEGEKSAKVNINTASKDVLMTIPGIGEAKAQAIIGYREEHGGFSSLEELKNIEGIKDGVFGKIKDYIEIN